MLSSRIFSGSNPYTKGGPVMEMWNWIDDHLQCKAIFEWLVKSQNLLEQERDIGDLETHLQNIASGHGSDDPAKRAAAERSTAHIFTHPKVVRAVRPHAFRSPGEEEVSHLRLGGSATRADISQRALEIMTSLIKGGHHAEIAREVLRKKAKGEIEGEITPKHLYYPTFYKAKTRLGRHRQRGEKAAHRLPVKSLEGSTERRPGEGGAETKERAAAEVTPTSAGARRLRTGEYEAGREETSKEGKGKKKGKKKGKEEKEGGLERRKFELKREYWIKKPRRVPSERGSIPHSELQAHAQSIVPTWAGGKKSVKKKGEEAAPVSDIEREEKYRSLAHKLGEAKERLPREKTPPGKLSSSDLERLLRHGTVEPEIGTKGRPMRRIPSTPEREAFRAGWIARVAKESGLSPQQVRNTLSSEERTGHEDKIASAIKQVGLEGTGRKSFKRIAKALGAAAKEVHSPERVVAKEGPPRLVVSPGYDKPKPPKTREELGKSVVTSSGKRKIVPERKALKNRRSRVQRMVDKIVGTIKRGGEEPSREELAAYIGVSPNLIWKDLAALKLASKPHLSRIPALRKYVASQEKAGAFEPYVSKKAAEKLKKKEREFLERPVAPPTGKLLSKKEMEPLLKSAREQIAREKKSREKEQEETARKERESSSERARTQLRLQQLKDIEERPARQVRRWLERGGPAEKRRAAREKAVGRIWKAERQRTGKEPAETTGGKLSPEELSRLRQKFGKKGARFVISRAPGTKHKPIPGGPIRFDPEEGRFKRTANVPSKRAKAAAAELPTETPEERHRREAGELGEVSAAKRKSFLASLKKKGVELPPRRQPSEAEREVSRKEAEKSRRQHAQRVLSRLSRQGSLGLPGKVGPTTTEEEISAIFLAALTEGLLSSRECAGCIFDIDPMSITEQQAESYIRRWFSETLVEGDLNRTSGTSLLERIANVV